MIILGIDPGYRESGYGIMNDYHYIASGVLKLYKAECKLLTIYQNISDLCKQHIVDVMVIENVFVNKNVQTTLKLGYVVGISILVAETYGIPYELFSPKAIKKQLISGQVSKEQVRARVSEILQVNIVNLHESDALAACITWICKKEQAAI